MYILADINMPYLLCTGLGYQYLAGKGNMNHCLHFTDLRVGGLEGIVIVKLYQYVCVREVPIFKMIYCMKFYLYICMRFQCRTNSEKLCDNLLLSFYKTCSCCWKLVFIIVILIFWCTTWLFYFFLVCECACWGHPNTDKFILSIQNGFICLKWNIFIPSR